MTKDSKVIEEWIRTINEKGENLNKWEQDFVESITEQFEQKKWISDKQEDILERIYSDRV